MNSFNRLQCQILLDDIQEWCQNVIDRIQAYFRRHNGRVHAEVSNSSQHSDGRVWIPVGNLGFQLRVIHLHPSKPSVSEALKRKCMERAEALQGSSSHPFLDANLIYPPEDDQISLSSLEDYWFNHWQGPLISADVVRNTGAQSSRFRRSHRRSKRGNRCSICHKKLAKESGEERENDQCIEVDQAVLAHVPSLKLDTRALMDDLGDRSDEDASKTSNLHLEEIAGHNATDEQLSRMHRVVDNEIRTSYSLFSDENVSRDAVDGVITSDISKDDHEISTSKMRTLNLSFLPRQSRSCPCSPKVSARKMNSNDLQASNSPKSRSFIGISKFSLSHSLLAVHRQASNSLIPEFMKPDSTKSEGSVGDAARGEVSGYGTYKPPSRPSSCRSRTRTSQRSISELPEEAAESPISEEPFGSFEDVFTEASRSSSPMPRRPYCDSPVVPSQKPSKLSLSYLVGLREGKDKTPSTSMERLSPTVESIGSPAPHSSGLVLELPVQRTLDEAHSKPIVIGVNQCVVHPLPDVVPKQKGGSVYSNTESSSNQFLDSRKKTGVVNLGFDGTEESSDFTEPCLSQREDSGFESQHVCSSRLSFTEAESHATLSSLSFDADGRSLSERADGTLVSPLSTLPLDETPMKSATPLGAGDSTMESCDQPCWSTIEESLRREEQGTPNDDAELCIHQSKKPLLMFLHGIGSSAEVWNQQMWYFLACGYEVVAPDLLGHGLSYGPRGKRHYTFDQMLNYANTIFDQFVTARRKVVLVGHNYGCALAVALTRGKPSNVSLLILLSSGGPSPLVPYSKNETGVSPATNLLSPLISCGCLSREFLYAPRGKHYPVVISDTTGLPASPSYVVEHTRRGQRWPEGDMSFHRRITIPVLLLYGMKDEQVSFVEMCEMEKTIPRAFLELIPGAGHELMTDRPEEVCHAMHRFMRRWKKLVH